MTNIAEVVGKLVSWKGYAAAALAGAVIVGASAWTVQGWRYGAQLSGIKSDWADERALQSQLYATEQEKVRTEEQRRFVAINEVSNEGQKKLDQIVLAERAAADERVRGAVNEYARRHRQAASNTGVANSGPTITDPIGLLAELLGELDDLAEIYAGTADRARTHGLTCERAYDALIGK